MADPASQSDLAKQLRKFLTAVGKWIGSHWRAMVAAAAVVFLAMLSYSEWDRRRIQQIEFYVGPYGGAGPEVAELIKKEIENASSIVCKYHVLLHYTSGFEQNRKLVSQDINGNVIGLGHDGFGDDVSDVAILTPLEWNYLHLLCRKGFYKKVASRLPIEPKSASFSQLIPYLQDGRVYFGPQESGTRQIAEIVLRHYRQKPEERKDARNQRMDTRPRTPGQLSAPGISDWDDMRSSLLRGDIDIGIFSGPVGAGIIREIARDGSSVLMGLDDVCPAICAEYPQIKYVKIPAHVYFKDDEFCPKPIQTLITRRVLMCSKAMSDRDAYAISRATAVAMENANIPITWSTLSPSQEQAEQSHYSYAIHPGATRVQQDRASPAWWSIGTYLFWTTIVWIAAEILRQLNRLPGILESRSYAALSDAVDKLIRELQNAPVPSDDMDEYDAWQKRIDKLGKVIDSSLTRDKISKRQADELNMRLETKTRSELRVRRPKSDDAQ